MVSSFIFYYLVWKSVALGAQLSPLYPPQLRETFQVANESLTTFWRGIPPPLGIKFKQLLHRGSADAIVTIWSGARAISDEASQANMAAQIVHKKQMENGLLKGSS